MGSKYASAFLFHSFKMSMQTFNHLFPPSFVHFWAFLFSILCIGSVATFLVIFLIHLFVFLLIFHLISSTLLSAKFSCISSGGGTFRRPKYYRSNSFLISSMFSIISPFSFCSSVALCLKACLYYLHYFTSNALCYFLYFPVFDFFSHFHSMLFDLTYPSSQCFFSDRFRFL